MNPCPNNCSLLGACVHAACVCDSGWIGADCSAADLLPLDVSHGYRPAGNASSWGGRSIAHGGKWHLFASQFVRDCPLSKWLHNSVVVRATSDNAAGPYTLAETVFAPFHHNPTVIGPTPDGYYLLFAIGEFNASNIVDCSSGVTPEPPSPPGCAVAQCPWPAGRIVLSAARSPAGPWSEPRVVLRNDDRPTQNRSDWDCFVTNPSAALLPNGTIALVFSSVPCEGQFEEALGIAFAPSWRGPFTQSPRPVWRKTGPAYPPPATTLGNAEDPFIWRNARGWHIVAHSQGPTNICGDGSAARPWNMSNACGVHYFARSLHGPWTPSLTPVYDGRVTLRNGSAATLLTMQRPQLVFGDDGVTPTHLFVGGSFAEFNRGTTKGVERTFAFEFRT